MSAVEVLLTHCSLSGGAAFQISCGGSYLLLAMLIDPSPTNYWNETLPGARELREASFYCMQAMVRPQEMMP